MKKIMFMIIILLSAKSVQATNYSSANKVCNFNGEAMVVELKGGVLRYIIGDYAMHKPPSINYSKGDLILSNMHKMNVKKLWQFESIHSSFGSRIVSPSYFSLTGDYGSYAPFNIYELCR